MGQCSKNKFTMIKYNQKRSLRIYESCTSNNDYNIDMTNLRHSTIFKEYNENTGILRVESDKKVNEIPKLLMEDLSSSVKSS